MDNKKRIGENSSGNQPDTAASGDLQSSGRRKAVKTLVSGVVAISAYHALPTKWGAPIIEQVFLPAHAATSGETDTGSGTTNPTPTRSQHFCELYTDGGAAYIDIIAPQHYVTGDTFNVQVTLNGSPIMNAVSVMIQNGLTRHPLGNANGTYQLTITYNQSPDYPQAGTKQIVLP